jgi:hypothetical protein
VQKKTPEENREWSLLVFQRLRSSGVQRLFSRIFEAQQLVYQSILGVVKNNQSQNSDQSAFQKRQRKGLLRSSKV